LEPFSLVAAQFAKEPRDTPVKVNAAGPSFTATDVNGHCGTRTVGQGATAAVRCNLRHRPKLNQRGE
jgi:hypothetical protein